MQLRELGAGCFGRVYALKLEATDGSVAVKTGGARAETEYQCLWAIGQAGIPHTVAAISALRNAGPPFLPVTCDFAIAMTRVCGVTLREYLGAVATTGMRVSMLTLRQWTAQFFDFLLHLEVRLKLTHGDLKLGNIMVDNMQLRVVDYTFASQKLSEAEWQCGTVCYMSPERLFASRPPAWATPEGPDIWAVGTLMATCALTGEPLAHAVLDADEAFYITDDQGRFNPRRTDTVYHLLSRSTPWFAKAVAALTKESGLDPEFIEQAIRLLLWTRAYSGLSADPQFGLPAMPDMEEEPLYCLCARYTSALVQAYDESGSRVFEKTAALLAQCMGPQLYRVWCKTQTWNPQRRGKLAAFQTELAVFPPVAGGPFTCTRMAPIRVKDTAFVRDIAFALNTPK